ncbi:MAG TPA: hypothetical protein VFE62_12385 [Gemmataceae bacterium]|nr:hypothetical protein [Gemmataceae bacterium]
MAKAKAKPKKVVKPKAKPKAKAKPKPAPKVKAKAKVKPKPKVNPVATPMPEPAPAPVVLGKPLIVKATEPGSGAGIESGFAIESPTGFPADCTVVAVSDQDTAASWSIVGVSFNGDNNKIMCVGITSTATSHSAGPSGTLQVTLSNPPAGVNSPVAVPVDYIDDLP